MKKRQKNKTSDPAALNSARWEGVYASKDNKKREAPYRGDLGRAWHGDAEQARYEAGFRPWVGGKQV